MVAAAWGGGGGGGVLGVLYNTHLRPSNHIGRSNHVQLYYAIIIVQYGPILHLSKYSYKNIKCIIKYLICGIIPFKIGTSLNLDVYIIYIVIAPLRGILPCCYA